MMEWFPTGAGNVCMTEACPAAEHSVMQYAAELDRIEGIDTETFDEGISE
jgi:hypothetical protein